MQIAKLSDIKKELKQLPPEQLLNVCLRLGRFKKDNKELLNYLLFEASNEQNYIEVVNQEIIDGFEMINNSSLYFAKKNIRKILRIAAKQIRYSGNKHTEVEVLICFCQQMASIKLPIAESRVLMNMYQNQLKKIEKAISTLHEDLRYDYSNTIEELKEWLDRKQHSY
jgi:hypothetical protein